MSRASGSYAPTEEGARIEKLLDEWRFAEGEAALADAGPHARAAPPRCCTCRATRRFLAGDYPAGGG